MIVRTNSLFASVPPKLRMTFYLLRTVRQQHGQQPFISSSSLLLYNHYKNCHIGGSNLNTPSLSFTTISTTTTTKKTRNSWRKQHADDVIPAATSSSSNGSITTTTFTVQPPPNVQLQFHDTPLGRNGMHLLDGLDHYTVYAADDGHPLSVYGIQSEPPPLISSTNGDATTKNQQKSRKPILLLHGRTWSSVPVYHLLGGPFAQQQQQQQQSNLPTTTTVQHHQYESRSLMEALLQKGLQPYCMDFRGFGGTHMDASQSVEPYRCVQDAEYVLQWIQQRHSTISMTTDTNSNVVPTQSSITSSDSLCNDETSIPALLGWSQGALVAQLISQRNFHHHYTTTTPTSNIGATPTTATTAKPLISKLILYGSIYDPLVRYPREPLYVSSNNNNTTSHNNKSSMRQQQPTNTYDAAIEDFTVEGTIPPEPARLFAEAALLSDPTKVKWKNLYQFNNCDPARVNVPCLVIAGDQDPYAPLHVQQELFCNLARASDRTWSILSGSDHACHLLDGRDRLINTVVSFVMNGKRTEPRF